MEDRVITQEPTKAHRPPQAIAETPLRPEAALLGELTMAASQRAMQDARLAIAAAFGRRADASDLPLLERAGMAAWEMALLGVIRDGSASPALVGLAVQSWLVGWQMIMPNITAMARALLEPVRHE